MQQDLIMIDIKTRIGCLKFWNFNQSTNQPINLSTLLKP